MPNKPDSEQLIAENLDLYSRLEKAETTLSEILSGEADALFVTGVAGAQLFTLKGADQSYRTLIENMSEGALTLTPEGLVLYANRRFAGMLRTPLEKVIGSEIHHWFAPESRQALQALLQKDAADNHREELALAAADGILVPVYLSVSRLHLDGIPDSICMVATDLTEQKRNEAILAAEKLSNAILEQAADAIVICDENGRIMRASKQAQALYGKNLLGQRFEHAFPLRQLDGTAFSPVDTIDTNHRLSAEARLEHNGQGVDLLVSVGHLKGARNKLLGSVVTLTDITERKRAEDKIRESKNFLQLVVENVPLRIFWKDCDLRYLGCNTQFAKDAGHSSPNELTGKTDFEMGWKDQAELYRTDDKEVLDSGVAKLDIEEPQTTPDGNTIWLRTSKVPLRDKDNQIIGILGLYQDITERRQAEEHLKLFRTLLDNSSDAIEVLDPVTLRLLDVNETQCRELGYSREELLSMKITDIDPAFNAELNKTIEAKIRLSGGARFESVHRREDGSTFPVEVSSKLIELDKPYALNIVRDITERKQAEEQIHRQAERLTTTLESITDAFFTVDREWRFTFLNREAERLLKRTRAELTGRDFWTEFPDTIGSTFEREYRRAMADNKAVGFEEFYPPLNTWFDVRAYPSEQGLAVYFRDITEAKRTAEEIKFKNTMLLTQQETSLDAILVVDENGQIISYNQRFIELWRLSPQLVSARMDAPVLQSVVEQVENPEAFAARVQYLVEHRDEKSREELSLKDGRVIDRYSAPVAGADGKYYGRVWYFRDITERKKAEQKFKDLLESAPDAMVIVNRDAEMVLVNARAVSLFGWRREELLGQKIDMLVPERFRAKHPENRNGFFAQPHARPMGAGLDLFGLHKDGTEFPVEISLSPLKTNEGTLAITAIRDITERKQVELALRTSEVRFKTMFEQAPLGIALIDSLNGRIYEVNPRFAEIAGRSMGEMANIDWLQITHPDDVQADMDNMALLNAGKINGFQMEKRYLHPDGTAVWIDMRVTPLKVEDKTHPRHLCMIQDITERRDAEARIVYLNRVHAVLSGINTLIVRVRDRDELFREACRIAVEVGGFRMAMIVALDRSTMKFGPVASVGVDGELLTAISGVLSSSDGVQSNMVALAIGEKKVIVSNDSLSDPRVVFGKYYAAAGVRSMAILPLIVSDEAVGGFVLYASEIEFFHEEEMKLLTELAGDIAYAIDHIVKQEQLDYLAYYDVLTGLANRRLFLERVALYMRNAAGGGHKLALLLIDLERFKNINDSLGRPAGDALLKQVAEWLTHNMGGANLLARVGTDHFAIVVPEVKHEGDLPKLFDKKAQDFLDHPFILNDAVFRIAAKAGIALFPDDGADADTLYKNAEAALKKAKARGDRYLFYTQKMTEAVAGKLTLENQLRQAIDNEEFVLYYQPKVNLVSGKVTSAEALIRWNDPRTGLVPPGQFIPILEETGLIYEVGRWALRQAIADYLRWRDAGLAAVRIAVNVSPLQLRNINFIDEIRQVIAFDLHATEGLELEITESLIMDNVEQNITRLQAIRAMGITIAIDDFGTGFSSLNYLARLPVDTLKIDRSFVIEMDAPEGLALVSTIILVAHALKLKVVAEGVETETQLRQLISLSCDEMQGFLFSKPVSAEIFEAKYLVPPDVKKE